MSKPAAGTLIATNSMTTDMVFAYLLNGSLATTFIGGQNITGLVNSVGGAQPLSSNNPNCGALSYDTATDSLFFPGADYLGLPLGLPIEGTTACPAITLLIGFMGGATATYNCVWQMSIGADQEFDPYVNGHVLSSALSSSRGDYVPPATDWFAAFNQLGITGQAGGSLLSYINGVLVNTRAADAGVGIGTPLIGANGPPFFGRIQFFYAWSRVLSATEMATLAADPYTPIFTGSVPAAQTITFPAISDQIDTAAPFALTATASSGLAVSYAVTSGPATMVGNVVTLTGIGTVTIQATQAGNGTYAAATPVSQSFNVTAETQTITFPAISDRTANAPPFALLATSSSGLPVAYALTSGPVTISGNMVTIIGVGSVTIQATQAGNGTYAAATPVIQSFVVTAAQRGNIAYDQIRASDRAGNGPQLLTYTIPPPATATSAGTTGQVAFDAAGNWYWCYAANCWARIGPAGYGSAAASPPSW